MMTEGEQVVIFKTETQQQPVTVTMGHPSDDGATVQTIQYLMPDGQVAQLQPGIAQATASGNTSVIQNSGAVPLMVGMSGSLASLQPQVTVLPQSVTAASATSPNPTPINTSNLPQMLFLNQVTMNGQTSFVLVDANNKPVQLPQGIQVINLPTSSPGQQLPVQPGADTCDEPLYVNAKQYHRILKRRQARAKLEASGRIPKERQKYLYESRHRHACNRVRGSRGIFMGNTDMKPVALTGTIMTNDHRTVLRGLASRCKQ